MLINIFSILAVAYNSSMYKRIYYVYILSNSNNNVLYVGITNNLLRRVSEHKDKLNKGSFSARYNIDKLVYYEEYDSVVVAIRREKQLKAGSKKSKVDLILKENQRFQDLYESLKLL